MMTFGVIVGNRGFFPDHLGPEAGAQMLAVLGEGRLQAVAPGPEDTNSGLWRRARIGALRGPVQEASRSIDGVIVTLPNFGEERAHSDTLRMAGLNVPVLVQATPDTPARMTITDRRDKLLRQDVGGATT